MNNTENKYIFINYKDEDVSLNIRFSMDDDIVWLTQNEIATLFNKPISIISEHIKNIYEKEFDYSDYIKHETESNMLVTYYNFDIVSIVGYRVDTKKEYKFRKWANSNYREYIKLCLIKRKKLNELSKEVNNTKKELKIIEREIHDNLEKVEKILSINAI